MQVRNTGNIIFISLAEQKHDLAGLLCSLASIAQFEFALGLGKIF